MRAESGGDDRCGSDRHLEALAAGWSVTHAAERGGHARQRFYELRERDEAFAAAWGEAVEAGTQRLEDEALRRAVEGYDEETFDGGGILVRRVRRYDSALLQQLLKARRPEMYRESVPATPSVTIVLREYRLGEGPEVDGKPGIIEGQARELPAGKPAS